MACNVFAFVIGVFMSFFITTSLQFNAFRNYLKGLIVELNDAFGRRQIDDGNDKDIQSMFRHIVCFHAATKEYETVWRFPIHAHAHAQFIDIMFPIFYNLFWNSAEIFKEIILVLVFSTVVNISSDFVNFNLVGDLNNKHEENLTHSHSMFHQFL